MTRQERWVQSGWYVEVYMQLKWLAAAIVNESQYSLYYKTLMKQNITSQKTLKSTKFNIQTRISIKPKPNPEPGRTQAYRLVGGEAMRQSGNSLSLKQQKSLPQLLNIEGIMASAANPRASAGDQKPPKPDALRSVKNSESKKLNAGSALFSTVEGRDQHKPFKIKKIQKNQKSNVKVQPRAEPGQRASEDRIDVQQVQPELPEDPMRPSAQNQPLNTALSTIDPILYNTMPTNNLKLQEIFKSTQSEINHPEYFSSMQPNEVGSAPHSGQQQHSLASANEEDQLPCDQRPRELGIQKRRHSYDGIIYTTPLDRDAYKHSKLNQIDQENKMIARVLDKFESSPSHKQEIIQDMMEQIDAQQKEHATRRRQLASQDKQMLMAATSQRALLEEEIKYSTRIGRFLDNIASQNYDEAEKCLMSPAQCPSEGDSQDQRLHRSKKQVTFNIQTNENLHGWSQNPNARQKPPRAQNKQTPLGPEIWSKTMPARSQSLHKLPPWYPRKQDAADGAASIGADDLNQGMKPKTKESGIIGDILKLVSSQDGSLRNQTSSRKLLAYLQQKILFNQRGEKQCQQTQNQKRKIEKEIENDLNYLNVFVQPIGSINIFTQEKQQVEEEDGQRRVQPATLEEELRNLILQSPLKSAIDDRVYYMMNKNPKPENKLSLTASSSTVQLQIEALDEILEAILQSSQRRSTSSGHQQQSATVDHQNREMKQDIIRQIWSQIEPPATAADQGQEVTDSQMTRDQHDPYLQGINIVESMSILGKKRKGQVDAHGEDELFDLTRIREFQTQLELLVDDEDSRGAKTYPDRVMTFLTEQYPPNQAEKGQEQLDEFDQAKQANSKRKRYQVNSKQKILVEQAKKFTAREAARNQRHLGKVKSEHEQKQRLVAGILQRIDQDQGKVEDVGTGYILSSSERQKLLYLCFVECTRQIGKHSKSQAMLLMKIWYEYFNHTQTEVRNLGSVLHRQIDEITSSMRQLVRRVQTELDDHKTKDIDVLKLKQDYNKTLDVLGIFTKRLYSEESKAIALRLRLDTLEDNLKLVYPNSMQYVMTKGTSAVRESTEAYQKEKVDQTALASGDREKALQAKQEEEKQLLEIENKNAEIAAFWSRIIHGCGRMGSEGQGDPGEADLNNEPNRLQTGKLQLMPSEQKPRVGKASEPQQHLDGLGQNKIFSSMLNKDQWLLKDPFGSRNGPGADQQPQLAIYGVVIEDIERILRVIPAKTQAQQQLDEALSTMKQKNRIIDQDQKLQARQEKEIRALHDRCTELTDELVEQQSKYMQQILALKKQNIKNLEEMKRLEAQKHDLERNKGKNNKQTSTDVDMEQEQILRQREFNQVLNKFRGINKAQKAPKPKPSKEQQESFLKGSPPLENVYLPISSIMQTVKQGRSQFQSEQKSVKNVLKMIAGLVQAKIIAMEKSVNDQQSLMNIDCFFYHHIQQTYGLEQLANKYCEIYLSSIEALRKKDARIELFRKFVGLDLDKLPYSIFEHYATMIKATNVQLATLFTQNLQNMFIDYNRVRHTFKDLLRDASEFVQKDTYQQLRKFTKVITDNQNILKRLELEDYEVFKDLQEQTIRSKFKSTANLLKALFEEIGFVEDGGSDDEDLTRPRYVNQQQFEDFLASNFDLNDYTRGAFNLGPSKTRKRIKKMLETFFIEGHGLDPQKLSQRDLTYGFREKVELRVPVAVFFHVGINACVDHENEENQQFAKIYQFYTQVEVEVDEDTGEMVTKHVREKLNLEGMDFQQLVLYLKDARCPMVEGKKRQPAFEIYKAACESKMRQKLTCDDFVETIRKYRLAPPLELIGQAMLDRETEIARFVRAELLQDGQKVPAEVEQAANRKKSGEAEDEANEAEDDKVATFPNNYRPEPRVEAQKTRMSVPMQSKGTTEVGGAPSDADHSQPLTTNYFQKQGGVKEGGPAQREQNLEDEQRQGARDFAQDPVSRSGAQPGSMAGPTVAQPYPDASAALKLGLPENEQAIPAAKLGAVQAREHESRAEAPGSGRQSARQPNPDKQRVADAPAEPMNAKEERKHPGGPGDGEPVQPQPPAPREPPSIVMADVSSWPPGAGDEEPKHSGSIMDILTHHPQVGANPTSPPPNTSSQSPDKPQTAAIAQQPNAQTPPSKRSALNPAEVESRSEVGEDDNQKTEEDNQGEDSGSADDYE